MINEAAEVGSEKKKIVSCPVIENEKSMKYK